MQTQRHVPLRRCVACRRSRPQAELLRFTQDAGGAWTLDAARRAGGRGAWICRDDTACRKPKALGRFFRAQAPAVAELLERHAASEASRPVGASTTTPRTHAAHEAAAPHGMTAPFRSQAPAPNDGGMDVRKD